MKTAKKIALLAMVAIAGYATYSSAAISIKERDALKVKADHLLKRGTNLDDSQISELESALGKLVTTEKYNRFAKNGRAKLNEFKFDILAKEAISQAEALKKQLTGTQHESVEKLVSQIKNLEEQNNQTLKYNQEWEAHSNSLSLQLEEKELTIRNLKEMVDHLTKSGGSLI